MNRKQELQTKIRDIQKQYAEASAELKKIQADELKAKNKERFKEFKLKIWYNITPDAKLEPIEEEDYMDMTYGRIGLPLIKYQNDKGEHTFIMLRSEEELPRITALIKKVNALSSLLDETQANRSLEDKLALQKVILGEE